MTSRKKLGLALTIVALGVASGITVLHAQGNDDSNSDDQNLNVLVQGPRGSWLGVDLRDVTAEQAREWKLGDNYGALVKSVDPDSPAAKAGIQPGDVIEQFGGQRVHSVAEIRRMVGETPPGRVVQVEVRRNGETKTLSATLERHNSGMSLLSRKGLLPQLSGPEINVWPDVSLPDNGFVFDFGGPRLGVEVEPLTEQLGAYFGVNDGKGVLVRDVKEGSAAAKAGLKAGDCIVKLNSTPIESADDLHRALGLGQGKSQDVTLTIVRDHKQQTLNVHLEAPRQDIWRPVPDTASNGGAASGGLEARVFDAHQLADEAQALRQELESHNGEVQKEAEAARAQVRQLRDQLQRLEKEKGEWMQLKEKENGRAMQQLRREIKQLRDSVDWGVV